MVNFMTKEQIADFLENYNNWRRDDFFPSQLEQTNPMELGKVLELAIEELRK